MDMPLRGSASPFSNVLEPDLLASFIARERETHAIHQSFTSGSRQVMLVGLAGMGKSSLAT